MKKLICLLLILVFVLAVCSCDGCSEPDNNGEGNQDAGQNNGGSEGNGDNGSGLPEIDIGGGVGTDGGIETPIIPLPFD